MFRCCHFSAFYTVHQFTHVGNTPQNRPLVFFERMESTKSSASLEAIAKELEITLVAGVNPLLYCLRNINFAFTSTGIALLVVQALSELVSCHQGIELGGDVFKTDDVIAVQALSIIGNDIL